MTLFTYINIHTYDTIPHFEVVQDATNMVIYPQGKILVPRDIKESDKKRRVLYIHENTIYIK